MSVNNLNLKDALAIVFDLANQNALRIDDPKDELFEEAKLQETALEMVQKHINEQLP